MKNLIASITTCSLVALMTGVSGCGKQETPTPVVAAPKQDDAKPAKSSDDKAPTTNNNRIIPPVVVAQETPKTVVARPTVNAKKDRGKPTETVALTAAAFGTEINKNADDAVKKFESVFVELSGEVRFVGSDGKEAFVTLDAGPESLGIKCVLAAEKEPWAKISRGSKIKVRGQWPEIFVQPSLEACALIDVGPNPAQEFKAEALADEFAKNVDATRKKYHEKPLIVTGIIEEVKPNELGAVRLLIKGAGTTRVDCGFNANDRADIATLKVGGTVRLVGEFSALESGAAPALRSCRAITQK